MPASATQIGRPREFDPDTALERAMQVFWAQGFEGTSLTDLTDAMGINRTSLYAAFGNKENLFRQALARYTDGPAAYGARALSQPTAWEVAKTFLDGAVRASTQPDAPPGCLGVQGSLAAGAPGLAVRDALIDWRNAGVTQLRDRFRRAIEEGDLPADSDPEQIARYLMTIANGVAVQAASGADREQLQWVTDTALRQWPPA